MNEEQMRLMSGTASLDSTLLSYPPVRGSSAEIQIGRRRRRRCDFSLKLKRREERRGKCEGRISDTLSLVLETKAGEREREREREREIRSRP